MLFGKLETSQFTFTALGDTEDEVANAIVKAWNKFCKVEKKTPYNNKQFKSEDNLKKSIHYLKMDVGIAYRLYNKIPPFEKDILKTTVEVPEINETKIKKQVIKQIIEQLLTQLAE